MSKINNDLVGQKIKAIRKMTKKDMEQEGWHGDPPQVIILENGIKLYASCDEEGNGSGCMFGRKPDGDGFYV
jgi:hypothetical protein